MVPATLSQLEEIAELSKRKDDLEDDYNKLSGSMDTMLDAMAAMTGSLNASANGLDQLNQARGIFSNGKGVIYSGTDALRADLSNLADVLEPVEDHIAALSKTITSSKATLNSMSKTVDDLKDDLKDMEEVLEDLEDGTGDVHKVLSSLGDLRKSLKTLQDALGGTAKDVTDEIDKNIDDNQNIGSITVAKVEEGPQRLCGNRPGEFLPDPAGTEWLFSAEAAATAKKLAETQTQLAGLKQQLDSTQAKRHSWRLSWKRSRSRIPI